MKTQPTGCLHCDALFVTEPCPTHGPVPRDPQSKKPPRKPANVAHRIATFLFGEPEEINGRDRCATYLYRWTLGSSAQLKLYLHRFVGDDWSRDLHDHPKHFTSIGLWGSYEEEHSPIFEDDGTLYATVRTIFRAPWFRSFPAEHRHRLRLRSPECWTLVYVGPSTREWGFWPDGRFVPWHVYVGGELGDRGKDCG